MSTAVVPDATLFARLRADLAERGAGRRCRVLLVVANPLGNAIGDTAMAADHLPKLRQLARRVDVTVWTANEETWRFLDPSVRTVPLVSDEQWRGDFDLIVVDGRPLTASLLRRATDRGVAVLQWVAGARHAQLTLGRQGSIEAPLPPASNMPDHVALTYEALGFPAVDRLRVKAPSSLDDVVFFNPFASNFPRSLSPAFTGILLDAVLPAVGPSTTWLLQSGPVIARHDDADGYGRLSAVLDSERYRGRLTRRAMDLSAYMRQVARSRFVIGADTSSQHLAAAAGRPSIAFYPPIVSAGFYLVWGPTAPSSLHFVAPPDTDPDRQRALASLIAQIVRVWLGERPSARRAAGARMSYELAKTLVADGRRYVEGDRSVEPAMERRLAQLRARLTAPMFEPVRRELELLCEELRRSGAPTPAARRAVTLRQLDALNSVKVLGWLAGALSAIARPAGARSSADRDVRSRGRVSRSRRGRTRER
jgi:hypothetical protein